MARLRSARQIAAAWSARSSSAGSTTTVETWRGGSLGPHDARVLRTMTSPTARAARPGFDRRSDTRARSSSPVAQQPGQCGRAVSVVEPVLLADDRGTSEILIVPRSRRWPAVSVNRIAPTDWGITGM